MAKREARSLLVLRLQLSGGGSVTQTTLGYKPSNILDCHGAIYCLWVWKGRTHVSEPV